MATDETLVTDVMDRLETVTDALATANRAAIVHAHELRDLRRAIFFTFVIFAGIYIWKGPRINGYR